MDALEVAGASFNLNNKVPPTTIQSRCIRHMSGDHIRNTTYSMEDHHAKTRDIYKKQHEQISADESTWGRIYGLYKDNTFNLPASWFRGKEIIDVGCGNIGALLVRMHALGAAKIHAIDIGVEWIEPLLDNLSKRGVELAKCELKAGSTLSIPYDDEKFDFTSINGVLLHLENNDEIERGFLEGARVTRKGGVLFTSWGPCGGLMQGVIFPAIRAHYRNDSNFREFIDTIGPEVFHGIVDKIVDDTVRHTGEKLDRAFLLSLFGTDYCVFLKNFIQAPSWHSNDCTPAYVEALYTRAGFVKIERLNSFVRRTDIRKYFAPLHYDREHPVSKILYGEGYVQYIGQKA